MSVSSQKAMAELTDAEREAIVRRLVNDPDSALLVSTMKSGTHWLRYLCANYIKVCQAQAGEAVAPVRYEGLQGRFSPIDRRRALIDPTGVRPGQGVYPFHGLSTMMWQHVDQNVAEYPGRIVYIYRNPLDYLISRYYYDKALWADEGRDVSSAAATIPWSITWYAESLRLMARVAKDRPLLTITYEDLKRAPGVTMGIVWRFLGVPLDMKALRRSVRMASAEVVQKEEEARGRPIVGPTATGNFVRDARVGQWREHLSDQNLAQIDTILRAHGFSLDAFDIRGGVRAPT